MMICWWGCLPMRFVIWFYLWQQAQFCISFKDHPREAHLNTIIYSKKSCHCHCQDWIIFVCDLCPNMGGIVICFSTDCSQSYVGFFNCCIEVDFNLSRRGWIPAYMVVSIVTSKTLLVSLTKTVGSTPMLSWNTLFLCCLYLLESELPNLITTYCSKQNKLMLLLYSST